MVQDAEENEIAGHEPPGAERDESCGSRDHGEALQISGVVQPVARREDEAEADDGQEGAGDTAREQTPARLGDDIGLDQPEHREVIGEMVDEHRQERDAASDVDDGEA